MSEANMELMRTFAREVVAYNNDGLRKILDENIIIHEAPTLPYGGIHRGPDAFIKLFETVNEIWEFEGEFQYTHFPAGPDAVLLLVEVDAIARETRDSFHMRLAELFTIRDGKIVELDVYYWDTARMLQALNATPVASGSV
jgi:uncharacterized protein